MEVKKDILWRVYLCFLGIVVFAVCILGRAVYIQQFQGDKWMAMAKEQQQKLETIEAERGTIYSDEGSMLSTSIPYFDVHIDFMADGLRQNKGKLFREKVDSLSQSLAAFFKDHTAAEYKKQLQTGYNKKSRYFQLKKNISFRQYQAIRNFPLLKMDPNKGGFITVINNKRLTPFGLLANRTIGLSREYEDSNRKKMISNVGLELTYDSILRGEGGTRLVQKLSPGIYMPVEGTEIEPESGKDIVTTLNVNIQDIAENALLKMLTENECTYGTCIVMEVKTGKIKAIANLGRQDDGSYREDLNYAIQRSEPGSTFKLATVMALLEDKYVTLNSHVNLEGGKWKVSGRTVYDSEAHGLTDVTVKQAFEHSSNVGMAKMAISYYSKDPLQFIDHLRKLHLNQPSGIGLAGEGTPTIKTPKSRSWSATTLPWMSFGYEVLVSPLQTLMMYNAVANEGKMMKPYLVSAIQQNQIAIRNFEPEVINEQVASAQTIKLLKECLEGVCHEADGTAFSLFKGSAYKVAGKTGTALMANGNKGYADHIYQSSFAGYFPANDPVYSCIVVIRNKPFAKKFYGAAVAGPVFKEVADKLYALHINKAEAPYQIASKKDSSTYLYAGAISDMKTILGVLNWKYADSTGADDWGRIYANNGKPVVRGQETDEKKMPDVRGMGLKDALYVLENKQVKVIAKGRGRVKLQSIEPGIVLSPKQEVLIELN